LRGAEAALPRTRRRKIWLLLIAGVVILFAALFGLLVTGSMPLEDGTTAAGGRVNTVVSDGFIAAYIVELDEGVALVDATFDETAAAILARLSALGYGAADVRVIFLTHGHGDHITGAMAFPDATIYALAADADLVAGERTAGNLFGRFREPRPTGITVDAVLGDHDEVIVGGTPVEVFALPGHTRGSAAYLVHGILFLGDAAAASSAGTLTNAPPIFSWDRELARQSLIELATELESRQGDVEAMAFGHQGFLPGIEALLEWRAQQE
jgi:glyoxylase-like metal-dependent hydrolase (beta-lactamase superfamily II)